MSGVPAAARPVLIYPYSAVSAALTGTTAYIGIYVLSIMRRRGRAFIMNMIRLTDGGGDDRWY